LPKVIIFYSCNLFAVNSWQQLKKEKKENQGTKNQRPGIENR